MNIENIIRFQYKKVEKKCETEMKDEVKPFCYYTANKIGILCINTTFPSPQNTFKQGDTFWAFIKIIWPFNRMHTL